MTDLKKLDAENRLEALELRSFIVEAPAGAGKTELLTQRYLKLLSSVSEPEQIIALTFTNKAAAEMRNRILQSLLDCENNIPITQPHKQKTRELAQAALKHANTREWRLLTQPSRLRIVTMDALCSSLARQMPLLSRLGGQPHVIEDASLHYAQAAQLALAEVAEETSLQAPVSLVLSFMQNDVEKLRQLLADMLSKREQWLHLAGQQAALQSIEIAKECQKALQYCIEEKLQAALLAFPPSAQAMLMPTVRFAASNLDKDHPYAQLLDWDMPLETTIDALSSWLVLSKFLLSEGNFRKPKGLNATYGFVKHADRDSHIQTFADVCELIGDPRALDALNKLPVVTNDDLHENSVIIQAFSTLLQRASVHLWAVFQAANEVDFVAIARSAIYALENEQGATDLALKLDYKISHLLVDEFQDTNATQMALLEQLTQGWEPLDGRTLFCVGDPMQSIYRFRKADVSLFLKAAENGIGHVQLKPLKLSLNNRSQPKVVEWINHSFDQIFPANDNEIEAAICYRPFIATRDLTTDEGVSVHALAIDSHEESDNAKFIEARYITDLIEKEQLKDPTQKIAVLVRSRNHLHELVSEIRRNHPNIAFQAVEIEELSQRQTVQDALSLTRALLHRADRVHWLNLLRAPWCGLTLADLHALCADNHHTTIWQLMLENRPLTADGQKRLTHVKNILEEAFMMQGRIPLRRWLEGTWLKLGGANTLVSTGDNRDVQAFFDLVEKLAQGNALDFVQLETAMEKLYAEPDIDASDNLQFMTIHGAKGLEFDCVILPALNRKPPNQDSPLVLWEKVLTGDRYQLLAAPYSKKNGNNRTSIYSYIKVLETTRNQNEISRLLYVAATRTKRRLHLIASAKSTEKGFSPIANSFLSLLWPKFESEFLQADIIKQADSTSEKLSEFISKLMRLPAPAALAFTSQTTIAASLNPPIENVSRTIDNLATDCGTLAHLYMELISNSGLNNWSASKLNSASPAMHKWLRQCGHETKIAFQAAKEVLAALTATIETDDGKWVLKTRETQHAELALTTTDAQHKIDCTFVEDNIRWIIDYKLTQTNENADLTVLARLHVAQLLRYENLFLHEKLPIKKAVFFLSHGRLITID